MTLTERALASPYTRASFQTLTKHSKSLRGLDTTAALRLLRRNVRDVAPGANHAVQHSVARELLQVWKEESKA